MPSNALPYDMNTPKHSFAWHFKVIYNWSDIFKCNDTIS